MLVLLPTKCDDGLASFRLLAYSFTNTRTPSVMKMTITRTMKLINPLLTSPSSQAV